MTNIPMKELLSIINKLSISLVDTMPHREYLDLKEEIASYVKLVRSSCGHIWYKPQLEPDYEIAIPWTPLYCQICDAEEELDQEWDGILASAPKDQKSLLELAVKGKLDE